MSYSPEEIQKLKDLERQRLWKPFTQMQLWQQGDPLIIERGEGVYLIDIEGARYIDGVSSLWVNTFGHRNPELDQAVSDQLDKIAHSTLLGLGNVPSIELADQLIRLAPPGLSRVFYSDSGSTAVEIAAKMAFQYWKQNGRSEKSKFITFTNSYHGDTIGSVSLGGIDLFHRIFGPLLFETYRAEYPNCYRCPRGLKKSDCNLACIESFESVIAEHAAETAAVVIEPLVQGAAGMLVSPPGFLKKVADICRAHDVLLIADEVAVGFGRTGKLFACEHEGVTPDLMALAKGISGGYLPLAATLATEKIYDAFLGGVEEFKTFFHGHTYTGNPLAAAVGLASVRYFEKHKVLEKMAPRVEQLAEGLRRIAELPAVGDVRGFGMMAGIELVADKTTAKPFDYADQTGAEICKKMRPKGLILRNLSDVIILMPPLVISEAELSEMLEIVYSTIKETFRS